ncbi:MAG: PucC family protein, partial [Pseudomonadota bacterium]
EVLGLSVSQTTLLTAWFAGGTLMGFALAAHLLARSANAHRLSALGMVLGIFAFSAVVFAAPLDSPTLFRAGAGLIGVGGGIFTVGTLIACMGLADANGSGLALGAWGAVQASAVGLGLAAGGIIRDAVSALQDIGFSAVLSEASFGYSVVYHLDIAFLVAGIVAIGPLVRFSGHSNPQHGAEIGLARLSS